jgi:predicted N-acetyltransferase YhbS
MFDLLPLAHIACEAVESLLDAAFGSDRRRRTAYLLRQGMPVINHLSFGIIDNRAAVGSIQCWPVSIADLPLILVGPVAVSPERQNQGLGYRLMHAALAAATEDDPPMVMIGDPEYYGRFGFYADGTDGWTLPGPWEPHRLLLRNPRGVDLPLTGILGPRL